MPRRKNPAVTFVLFLVVAGFGYAAYHFLWVEKVFASKEEVVVPAEQIDRLRQAVEEGLTEDPSFQAITSFNWRGQTKRYKVDVAVADGSTMTDAKRMARRVNELVERASDGSPAEVSVVLLGREIHHFTP
jgi:hypothetical protein